MFSWIWNYFKLCKRVSHFGWLFINFFNCPVLQTKLSVEQKNSLEDKNMNKKYTVSLTNVISHEVSGETLGTVAEGRVVVRVAAKDKQGAAEQDGWVEIPGVAALFQDEPANAGVADKREWMHNATIHFKQRRRQV